MENIIKVKIVKFLEEEILWEYSPKDIVASDIDDYDDNEYTFELDFEVWGKKINLPCMYNLLDDKFKVRLYEEGEYDKFDELNFWKALAMYHL